MLFHTILVQMIENMKYSNDCQYNDYSTDQARGV